MRRNEHDEGSPRTDQDQRGLANGLHAHGARHVPLRQGGVIGRTNGLTNGLTNGITNGLTNGLTNGISKLRQGMTNGKTNGLTNGFVNGKGAVNGFRLSYQPRRLGAGPADMRRKLVAVLALVTIVIAIPYALVYAFPPEQVEVDGYFMDWLKAEVYHDSPDSADPDVAIESYAMRSGSINTYLYIATEGTLFQGRDGGADGFYMFIDRDGDAGTGYSVRGVGADALVVVAGWNGTVMLKESYVFDPSAGKIDFAGFTHVSDPVVAFKGGEMEIGTTMLTGSNSVVAVCARHTNASDDWSEVNFGSSGTAVRVLQDHDASEVTAGLTDEKMLTLTITAKGPRTYLEGLRFECLGSLVPSAITVYEGLSEAGTNTSGTVMFTDPVRLDDGSVELEVLATFPAGSETGSFGLELNATDPLVLRDNATVTVQTVQSGARVAYVASAPDEVVIDGAFGDWGRIAPINDALNDTELPGIGRSEDPDIDIESVKLSASGDMASFFMSVDGHMLAGTNVPAGLVRWSEPSGPAGNVTNITETMYGADFAFVFIDADMNDSTGFSIGSSEVSLVAVGKDGVLLSAMMYRLVDGVWTEEGAVQAAIDGYRLELGASFSTIGLDPDGSYPVTFLSQDWRGCEDDITVGLWMADIQVMRSFGGVIINEIYNGAGTSDWIELYNTGPVPVDVTGWRLSIYDSGGHLLFNYTYPAAVIQPGEFLVANANFGKGVFFQLWSDDNLLIDQVAVPTWRTTSYGRTGTPAPGDEYSTWDWMNPTPGAINEGQVPIPEFDNVLIPLAIVPIMFLVIRRKRRTRAPPAEV